MRLRGQREQGKEQASLRNSDEVAGGCAGIRVAAPLPPVLRVPSGHALPHSVHRTTSAEDALLARLNVRLMYDREAMRRAIALALWGANITCEHVLRLQG